MEILELKVLRGPNYWSAYRKHLIEMKLDLRDFEELPTNKIPRFREKLQEIMPELEEHRCSKGYEGGFFERLDEGTWLGHVTEHIALELQSMAGMPCGYGRTRSARKNGVYHVVFSYCIESAGLYAAKAAVNLVKAIAMGQDYDLKHDVEELKKIKQREGLGPSTRAIVQEAKKRDIPVRRLDNRSTVMLGHGKHQKIICATEACSTGNLAVERASNKAVTKRLLAEACIPVPKGDVIYDAEELQSATNKLGFPVVIKPLNGNHGRGITTGIQSIEQAMDAFTKAKEISSAIIVEQHFEGSDYRLLLVNYKLVAASRRIPAMVVGDGESTIEMLIAKLNEEAGRGDDHDDVLTKVKIDNATLDILKRKLYSPDTVLQNGEALVLKDTANISTGGTARDVTDIVHPDNIFIAERAARIMGLDICGIDVIAQDITKPFSSQKAAILEVNAAPGFRMHLSPSKGLARNVAEPVIEMLFPGNSDGRIPLIAVTGTNGKTTTTRLIAHIAATAGFTPGYTTTDGIYIGKHAISQGDCSGPSSAHAVLRDPIVDFAVLECARGGILRSGLGFDKCDTSIITNVTADHLGLNEIDTLDAMARVKAVVAHATRDDGYTILNADDDLVYNIRRKVDCNIALWSMHADNDRIKKHCTKGGLAVTIDQGYYILCKDGWKSRILKVRDVPLTLDGRAECMIKNIMPAILACVIHQVSIDNIRTGLKTFYPEPGVTPGRMNIFKFPGFEFMLDYGHNPDGFKMMKIFLEKTDASVKTGIIGCPGDRRDKDIIEMGALAAEMFDRIIIRHDIDSRGRTNEDLTNLIMRGVNSRKPGMQVDIVSGETQAIQFAIDTAEEGSFIVLFSELVKESIRYISSAQEKSLLVE